jgi:hypothetical protein
MEFMVASDERLYLVQDEQPLPCHQLWKYKHNWHGIYALLGLRFAFAPGQNEFPHRLTLLR